MEAILEIRNQYNQLGKTDKRIADYFLKQEKACIDMTALELANACDTSNASIIRFVKKLGFNGLDSFKRSLLEYQTIKQQEYSEKMNTIITKDDSFLTLSKKLQTMVHTNIQDFFYQLDYEEIERAINAIRKARKLYVFGIGSSALPASDLFHKLKRVNFDAEHHQDLHMMTEFFHYLNNEDVIIVFSYSGLTKEVIYPCKVAKDKGATVIAITRHRPSVLRSLADIALLVPDNENQLRVGTINSKYSSLLMVDILYLGTIQEKMDSYLENLVETRTLIRKYKEDE